jgi:hypothetical protein
MGVERVEEVGELEELEEADNRGICGETSAM